MTHCLRALISGYYGFGNAGDEAILAGLVQGFRRLDPSVELTVLSKDPLATESEHGVLAVDRGLRSARQAARGSHLLVSGGGGLLQDVTSWRSSLYYLSVIDAGRAAGVPVAVVGQGIGPLHLRLVRGVARRVLSQVDVIAVRDTASRDILREIGVRQHVEVTADLAFLLPRPTEEEIAAAWRLSGLDRGGTPAAAIAVRPAPRSRRQAELASTLGRTIGDTCAQLGVRPILVAMQSTQDLAFARRVASAMPRRGEVVASAMSARQLLALIAGCDLVVGMRLHALIYAAICSAPPVAISYDPKVDGLMAQLGLPVATALRPLDAGALAEGMSAAWRSRDSISCRMAERVGHLRTAAVRNIELMLPLLRAEQ
jgi:polysaccharide pyruvyl transferase CsaB